VISSGKDEDGKGVVDDVQRVCSSSLALSSKPSSSPYSSSHSDELSWTKLMIEHERTGRLVPRDCQTGLDTLERGYYPGEERYGRKSAVSLRSIQLMSRTKIVHSELDLLSPGFSPMPDSQSSYPRSTVLTRLSYSSKIAFLVEMLNWQR